MNIGLTNPDSPTNRLAVLNLRERTPYTGLNGQALYSTKPVASHVMSTGTDFDILVNKQLPMALFSIDIRPLGQILVPNTDIDNLSNNGRDYQEMICVTSDTPGQLTELNQVVNSIFRRRANDPSNQYGLDDNNPFFGHKVILLSDFSAPTMTDTQFSATWPWQVLDLETGNLYVHDYCAGCSPSEIDPSVVLKQFKPGSSQYPAKLQAFSEFLQNIKTWNALYPYNYPFSPSEMAKVENYLPIYTAGYKKALGLP